MHNGLARRLFEVDARLIERLAKQRGWTVNSTEFPVIDVTFVSVGRTSLRVRMDCKDSPREPVSFHLMRADGAPLEAGPSPEIHPNPTGVLNQGPHSSHHRPFVCSPGSREYHTHESHLDDTWDSYRTKDGYRPAAMLTQVWRAWEKGTG